MFEATVLGHAGSDVHTGKGETPVGNFSIAVTQWSKADGESTEWVRVSLFGKQLERAKEIVTKGALILVQGPVTIRRYTSKDGEAKAEAQIIANRIVSMGRSVNGERAPAPAPAERPGIGTSKAGAGKHRDIHLQHGQPLQLSPMRDAQVDDDNLPF